MEKPCNNFSCNCCKDNDEFEQLRRISYGGFDFNPPKTLNLSELTVTEIQYLRGLITTDKLVNDYENDNAMIDRKTTMHEFTENLLEKLDKMEL